MRVHVCLAVWGWMAPFRVGVRPCGLHWLLWREAGGPSWFREKSSLTSQGSLTVCQPTWLTKTHTAHTHTHTQSHSAWLKEDCTQRKRWESHTTLSAIKKIYFTANVGLAMTSARCCLSVRPSAEPVHGYKHNMQKKKVWWTHSGLLFTWGQRCVHPQSLQRFNHFSWPAARILAKIAAYLWQNCPISLNAMCRIKKKNNNKKIICWQPGAGPANYTWPWVLLIRSCFSPSHNTLLEESWFGGLTQIVL